MQPTLNVGKWILLALSAFLLLSMGGGIFAAPITLPLLYVAVRHTRSLWFRIPATAVATLTAAEVFWAVSYFALGEQKPWIWLVPLLAALVTIPFYGMSQLRTTRSA